MALFRKLFYKKPPDGLLEICEGVYGIALFAFRRVFNLTELNCLFLCLFDELGQFIG